MQELITRNFELAEKIFGYTVYSENNINLDYTSYKNLIASIEYEIAPRSLNTNLRSEIMYTFFKKEYNIQREKADRAKHQRHVKKLQAEIFKRETEKTEEIKTEDYYFNLNFHDLNKFIQAGSDFMKLSPDLRFKLFNHRQFLYEKTYRK